MTQGMFNLGAAIGAAPAQARAKQLEEERKKKLAGFDPNTVEGLQGLAQYYQSQGDLQSAAQLATAARNLATQEANATALANRKVQISTQATNLGLDDLASQIANVTDSKELGDLVGTMIDYRLKNMPTQTPAQRKQLARQRGISDKLFKELGLGQAPDQVFNDVLTGQRGGKEEFFTQNGKVLPFRTEGGQVYDRENNRWVELQELGLQRATPQVQRIQNLSSSMAEKLMGEGVEQISSALEQAEKSAGTVQSLDRQLELLEQGDLITGYGADFRRDVVRLANFVNPGKMNEYKGLEDSEEYLGLAAKAVADYITNLGSGTGLSDTDLKFSKQVTAADLAQNPEAMRRLLTHMRNASTYNISRYNTLRNSVENALKTDEEKASMVFFPLVDMPPEMVEPGIDDTDLTTGSTVTVKGVQYIVDQ
jgi:hypothetical protein